VSPVIAKLRRAGGASIEIEAPALGALSHAEVMAQIHELAGIIERRNFRSFPSGGA
jgi:hypothetical protein